MRNYSHLVIEGVWLTLSKAQKREIAASLLLQPDVAVVAESGQKHLIFRARPGWWLFEETQIAPDPSGLTALLRKIEALYGAFSKAEIETGRYRQHRVMAYGLDKWCAHEDSIRAARGTPLFRLALFLAQRGETDDGVAPATGGAADANLGGHRQRIQESLPGDHLAAVRGSDTQCGVYVQSDEVRQLTLFEA